MQEMRRTAQQMQRVASALEKEIPDTASTMRLTGLELADAIQEVSLLGSVPNSTFESNFQRHILS